MPRPYLISALLGAALVPGCLMDISGSDTQGTTTATSTSTTGGSLSGPATSAPGSTSSGTASGGSPTTTGPDSSGNPWTSGPCGSFLGQCGDLPGDPIECDAYVQDCPEGQKCAAVITDGGSAWDGLRCVEVTGTNEPGDLCKVEDVVNGLDSCVQGAMCWDADAEGVGYCVAQCTGSAEAPVCENGAPCIVSGDSILILCIPPCDPLLQDCPHPGHACYDFGDDFYCEPDYSDAEGQANDPCEYINFCDPGLMCADPALVGLGCPEGSTGCCTPFCKFPDGACPNPDQECVQYFDPMTLPPGDPMLDIGFCGVTI